MTCVNCPDISASIRECAPYANKNDVIDLLNRMTESCCVGVPTTTFLNPASSNAVAATMVAEAFPLGADTCYCPCKYIVDETNEKVYMNCTENLNLAVNWNDVSGVCTGVLTTPALNPSVNAAGSMLEAFPLGVSVHCEHVILIREDGNICYSSDGGSSFQCSSTGAINEYGTIYYQEANGVDGIVPSGSLTWVVVPLNTIDINENSNILSLASNRFVLRAGTYDITISVPLFRVNGFKARLYDFTAAALIEEGLSGNSGNSTGAGVGGTSISTINTKYTSNGINELRVDVWCAAVVGSSAIGKAASTGNPERHAFVKLVRVSD